MLLKSGTDTAAAASQFTSDVPAVGAALPDQANAALAAARTEIDDLRNRLAQIDSTWQSELSRARKDARIEAAAQHVTDDAARLDALSATLVAARESFVAEISRTIPAVAAQLAAAALKRLVDVRRDDADWLLRVVSRRLADIDRASIVAVVLPQACQALADQLEVPAGTTVVIDHHLPAGSARIDLAMGTIPIRIDEGLARVLAALDKDYEPHG